MHRASFMTPGNTITQLNYEEFQALEELIYERLREPRQSTSAGHNEQQRLAARQSGRIEGFNSDLNAARDSEVNTASEAILLDRAKSVIASRINFLEDRLSALSTTVARNKKEWNESQKDFNDRIEAFDVAPTQLLTATEVMEAEARARKAQATEQRLNFLEDRLKVLEKQIVNMRLALHNAGKV